MKTLIIGALAISLGLTLACGSDSGGGSPCGDAAAKAQSCGVTGGSITVEQCEGSEQIQCMAKCVLAEDNCAVINETGGDSTAFDACMLDCTKVVSGAGGTTGGGGGGNTGPASCTAADIAASTSPSTTGGTDCPAYEACVESCVTPIQGCFETGGACSSYVECAVNCNCDSTCIQTDCAAAMTDATCTSCYSSALTCAWGCMDQATACQ